MENSKFNIMINSVYEDKANPNGQSVNDRLEVDVQVAYLNMLHAKS